jgi:hypothetical protein
LSISWGKPEDGTIKNPVKTAGFFRIGVEREVYRARRPEVPGWGAFFDDVAIHRFVIMGGGCDARPKLSTPERAAYSALILRSHALAWRLEGWAAFLFILRDAAKRPLLRMRFSACTAQRKKSRARKSPA